MDFFTEYIIQRKDWEGLFYIGLILFAFIVLYMGLVFAPYFGNLFCFMWLVFPMVHILVRRFNIEYEYIFTNGELI